MLLGCDGTARGVGRCCGYWETDPMMPFVAWDAPGASQYEVLRRGASGMTVYRYPDLA